MPGHTFVYSPPVNKVKELIDADVLGEIYFVTSSRMNLGKYQPDGVICDLAPHDLSILLYWLEQPVVEVAASGRSVFQDGVHETAFITLTFAGGASANIQVSWLAPRKVREMTVVGSHRMVQYDDTAVRRGRARLRPRHGVLRRRRRSASTSSPTAAATSIVPRLEAAEPLSLELADFAQRDPHRRRAALATPSSGSRSCWRWRRPRSRCAATASRSRSRPSPARVAA